MNGTTEDSTSMNKGELKEEYNLIKITERLQ